MLGPPDIERIIGITGGNIFHGEILPDQMFGYRPVPGYSDYRTPVDRLYLCGSGAWPGGAVFGAPGRNCALEALRDLGSNPSSVATRRRLGAGSESRVIRGKGSHFVESA